MNRRSLSWLTAASLLACAASGFAIAASAGPTRVSIAIIVSEDWESMSEVRVRDLQRIYLRTSNRLAGRKIEPVDHETDTPIYEAFMKQVVRKSRKALADYWLEQALTGGLRPPRQMAESQAVIAFVARNVGAIAYVDLDSLEDAKDAGVKVLRVVQPDGAVGPSQPGYSLRYTRP